MMKSTLLLVSAAVALLVASGVAWAATIRCPAEVGSRCVGTSGTDTIYGIDHDVGYGGDWIVGREGADKIYGRGGADRTTDSGGGLHGQNGDDLVRGGGGQDHIYGGLGADRLFGGSGPDSLHGENPAFVGEGRPKNRTGDLLVGGPGDDSLYAWDNTEDQIYCGKGYDNVVADAGGRSNPYDRPDFVDDSCEDVRRRIE